MEKIEFCDMATPLHPNFAKASRLIFLTLLFGVYNLFFGIPSHGMTRTGFVITGLIMLSLIAACAIGIRKGIVWVKYVYIAVAALGIIGTPVIVKNLSADPILGVVNLLQCLVQLWAAVLLLRAKNPQIH
ncbi:DUF2417 domain-containing protein [Flavobacterium sp. N1718]|uniref:DUF2417 domain-containing protein n=1 Tax=Flavobacterium sp. N1718 TaxID=2986822 RepID=UPI00222429A1|nr:DUF2417 domain-containing protein [Flavobacterium sp. N1718]